MDEIARQEVIVGPNFLRQILRGQPKGKARPTDKGTRDYSGFVDQVVREDFEAAELLTEVVRLPRQQRSLVIRNQARYQTLGMARLLLSEAKSKFQTHGASAEELARLALVVLEQLGRKYDEIPELIGSCKAMAHGYLANALRIQGRFPAARGELKRAWSALEEDFSHCQLEQAWLLRFQATLWRDLHLFQQARESARKARILFFRLGQEPDGLWMVVSEAVILEEEGRAERALRLLDEWQDELTEKALGLAAFTSAVSLRALLYARLERFLEAHSLIEQLQELDARTRGIHHARLVWIEALIRQGLGQDERARSLLNQSLEIFVRDGCWLDGALVTLDLAQLCVEHKRAAEGAQLAKAVAPVFDAYGQTSDALTALQLFLQAAQQEAATHELLQKAREAIRSQQLRGNQQAE